MSAEWVTFSIIDPEKLIDFSDNDSFQENISTKYPSNIQNHCICYERSILVL